jgi:hypothetical protein
MADTCIQYQCYLLYISDTPNHLMQECRRETHCINKHHVKREKCGRKLKKGKEIITGAWTVWSTMLASVWARIKCAKAGNTYNTIQYITVQSVQVHHDTKRNDIRQQIGNRYFFAHITLSH